MALYRITGKTLKKLNTKPFKLEKDIQTSIEKNLESTMGLVFIATEFTIKNKRIDTLAYDPESKSFVIIEYKRDKNASVVDQGFTYLHLMLNNKADFILEYNETQKTTLQRKDIDWTQTKIIFVAPNFTDNQREATNSPYIAIELWEVQRYEGNIISITPIKKTSAASLKAVIKDKKLVKEIKIYTEEGHLNGKTTEVVELYKTFKQAILNLSDHIETKPLKLYMAFKVGNVNVCDIAILKKGLKLWINKAKGTLDDPQQVMRNVAQVGHWGNGDYDVNIYSTKNLEYILSLIKQALPHNE